MRLNFLRRVVRHLSGEDGFTIIELGMTALILAIVSAPIAAVLMAAGAQSASARTRTGTDQLLASQVELLRTLPYTQVGVSGGNPDGVLNATASATLANGLPVTIATKVSFVSDAIPTAYVTNADYKKVVITITQTSNGKQLGAATTYVASASAPPLSGTDWVQIKRTVLDAFTNSPVAGASMHLTGGPSPGVDRTDTTDGAGVVLFPALDDAPSGTPVYTLAATAPGYTTFPDDNAPGQAGQITSAPATNSVMSLRMYKNGGVLTLTLQNSNGTPYVGTATISLQSSRCGVAPMSVTTNALGQVTINQCQWAQSKTVDLPPNVLSQTPLFDKYSATAYTAAGAYGTTTAFTFPSNYPTVMTQSATIRFGSTTYTGTGIKTLTVTVTKNGSADKNARVLVSGGPANITLYGTTNNSGQATFTIPASSTSTTYTIAPNDMGAVKGTQNVSVTTSTTSPINQTVPIS